MREWTMATLAGLAFAWAVLSSGAQATTATPLEVRLDTVAVSSGEPIWDKARIGVWAMDNGTPGDMVARRHATPAQVMLAPGDYRVVVLYRSARGMRDMRVAAGVKDQQVVVNLNAGEVTFELVPRLGAEPVRDDLTWNVHHYAPGNAVGTPVARTVGDNPELLLSDGWYEVQVEFDGQLVEHVIKASAGRRTWYSLVPVP